MGNREPRNVLSLQDDPRFPAEAVAGLRGAVALPAIHAREVLAVLEFCCEPVSVDVTDRLLRSLTGIGYELGEFLATAAASSSRPPSPRASSRSFSSPRRDAAAGRSPSGSW